MCSSDLMVGRSEPGCDLGPTLSFKDLHHPGWGGGRAEPGLYLPHGSAGHLFFQLLVVETILQLCGGGVLQPCQGRRTVAAQLGCNIPPSPSHSRRGRQRGSAGALGSGPLFGFNSWFASLEREREREPSGGRVHPGPWLLLQRSLAGPPTLVAPQARGRSCPRGTEPEFRL